MTTETKPNYALDSEIEEEFRVLLKKSQQRYIRNHDIQTMLLWWFKAGWMLGERFMEIR